MSAPPYLSVVGKGAPPDSAAEMAEVIAKATVMMTDAVKAGGLFWLMAAVEGDDMQISYAGDALEACALAEEVAGNCKRQCLGLEP